MKHTTKYDNGTQTTQELPWGRYTGAYAMCSDGIIRRMKRIAPTPDTFFSVPGAVRVKGKTVSGFISVDDTGVTFTATGVNASLLL